MTGDDVLRAKNILQGLDFQVGVTVIKHLPTTDFPFN